MSDVEATTIEHVTVEFRRGRRLEPAGAEGRRGVRFAAGPVDKDWIAWLPQISSTATGAPANPHTDGDWFWIYEGSGSVWTLAWEGGLPSAEKPMTALDDLEASRERRGELQLLEVKRATLESQIALGEERVRRLREDEASLTGALAAARALTIAEKKSLQDDMDSFRIALRQERSNIVQEHDKLRHHLVDHIEEAQKLETKIAEHATARGMQASNTLQDVLDMQEQLVKAGKDSFGKMAPVSGWELMGNALAEQVKAGLLKDIGGGVKDLIKLVKANNT